MGFADMTKASKSHGFQLVKKKEKDRLPRWPAVVRWAFLRVPREIHSCWPGGKPTARGEKPLAGPGEGGCSHLQVLKAAPSQKPAEKRPQERDPCNGSKRIAGLR